MIFFLQNWYRSCLLKGGGGGDRILSDLTLLEGTKTKAESLNDKQYTKDKIYTKLDMYQVFFSIFIININIDANTGDLEYFKKKKFKHGIFFRRYSQFLQ